MPQQDQEIPDRELDIEAARLLERLCSDFERRLRAEQPVDVDTFVNAAPENVRSHLAHEIAAISLEFEGSSPGERSNQEVEDVGPYELDAEIGRGAMGVVYRARDKRLDRLVALKVIHASKSSSMRPGRDPMNEARCLAAIDHANVVPVYDVGTTSTGRPWIATRLIEGDDLSKHLSRRNFSFEETSRIVADLADALHVAHQRGLVHRDVKPSNVILDSSGHCWLTDFGIALADSDFGLGAELAGTPEYMSPEQARGESHHVDGRSDVFSLGLVLYRMLAGRHPFRGRTADEIRREIAEVDVRPPRQIADAIPVELERTCLKALSRRASDRFTTARDMADELRTWLDLQKEPETTRIVVDRSTPGASSALASPLAPPTTQPTAHGLKPFDVQDGAFFRDLLPGPRDGHGVPESLMFWVRRIREPEHAVFAPVGIIYGPSGCGKTSFVRAGVVPLLDERVRIVNVEASTSGLDDRILQRLRRRFPSLENSATLSAALAAVRRGTGPAPDEKLLIIIDQLEQNLHSAENIGRLAPALRQCDGIRCQALLIIRDDFWLGVSRLMREADLRIAEGQNAMLIDLFTKEHSRRVLRWIGQVQGTLPPDEAIQPEHERFVAAAVDALAVHDRVVCLQLTLLAETMRDRPWNRTALKDLGGAAGIGVAFLTRAFDLARSRPDHRPYLEICRRILYSLLPREDGSSTRPVRSESELREAAETHDVEAFDDAMRILDVELRLISPRDSASGTTSGESKIRRSEPTWHLAHDYLVPALRRWFDINAQSTWRGRARLRLREWGVAKKLSPESPMLPGFIEWCQMSVAAAPAFRTIEEQSVMSAARKRHLRMSAFIAIAAFACVITYLYFDESMRHENDRRRVEATIETLAVASSGDAVVLAERLLPLTDDAVPILRRTFELADAPPRERLNAALILARLGEFTDVDEYLAGSITTAPPETFVVMRSLLGARAQRFRDAWRSELIAAKSADRCLRAACLVLDRSEAAETAPDGAFATDIEWLVEELLRDASQNPSDAPHLIAMVEPVRRVFRGELERLIAQSSSDDGTGTKNWAAAFLAALFADEPHVLMEAMLASTLECMPILLNAALPHRLTIESDLWKTVRGDTRTTSSPQTPFAESRRKANAALALLRMPYTSDLEIFFRDASDATFRSLIVSSWHRAGVSEDRLRELLERSGSSVERAGILEALAERDLRATGARGSTGEEETLQIAKRLFSDDADPTVHGAARLLLLRRGAGSFVDEFETNARANQPVADRRWWVNSLGMTMMVVESDGFANVGSPLTESGREPDEVIARRPIPKITAFAAHETTIGQFRTFMPTFDSTRVRLKAPESECPVLDVTWDQAAAFCNWLSRREGLEEWYEIHDDGSASPRAASASRRGYRLPTEDEWEGACRMGSAAVRFFGTAEPLLDRYAWFMNNAPGDDMVERSRPVGRLLPNPAGLFDVYGNVMEWCHDAYSPDRDPASQPPRAPRAIRGGCFYNQPFLLRSADRVAREPWDARDSTGFRVVRTL